MRRFREGLLGLKEEVNNDRIRLVAKHTACKTVKVRLFELPLVLQLHGSDIPSLLPSSLDENRHSHM